MVTLLEIMDLVCMMAFNAEENNHFNFEGYIFFCITSKHWIKPVFNNELNEDNISIYEDGSLAF